MSWKVSDVCCNRLTGATAVVEAAEKDSGRWRGQVRVRYQQSGLTYFIAPEFLTDVSRSAEIIRAGKKRKSTSLADDDE